MNILDVRKFSGLVGGEGQIMLFSRVPNNRRILFAVYAFDNPTAANEPIAVYCTEADVAWTSGLLDIDATPGFADMVEYPAAN
ncbi:MAG: hypothetical protein HC923_11875 [Myxococcales bacterium]|nr:hypothetical protein [Myxococcales bacterium]